MITDKQVSAAAAEWSILTIKTWAKKDDNGNETRRAYISKRGTDWGYIDLNSETVHPVQKGVSHRSELESVLEDMRKA